MRLITTFKEQPKARHFYSLLMNEGIEALYEIDEVFKIWVYKEDDYSKALALLKKFEESPHETKFDAADDVHIAEFKEAPTEISEDPVFIAHVQEMRKKLSARVLYSNIEAKLTKVVMFICILLFLTNWYQQATMEHKGEFTPLEQSLLYDAPTKVGGLLSLEPTDEEKIVLEAKSENVFIGYYYIALNWPSSKSSLDAPKFTQIKEGQLWRIVSPALMHGSVLHILFNMMWFWLLGKQIEERLGKMRSIVMMVIIASVSNTAEYLMVGPIFLGISGVVCGQAGFIWMRQRVAPWEGYPLQKGAALFLAIFVLGIVGLQVVSFVLKLTGSALLPIQIANTAHMVGAMVGMALAKFGLFARHKH